MAPADDGTLSFLTATLFSAAPTPTPLVSALSLLLSFCAFVLVALSCLVPPFVGRLFSPGTTIGTIRGTLVPPVGLGLAWSLAKVETGSLRLALGVERWGTGAAVVPFKVAAVVVLGGGGRVLELEGPRGGLGTITGGWLPAWRGTTIGRAPLEPALVMGGGRRGFATRTITGAPGRRDMGPASEAQPGKGVANKEDL